MVDFIYRTVPFTSLAVILLGWMLIELLQTPRKEWDAFTWTIATTGTAAVLYLLALAINYAPIPFPIEDWMFQALRMALALSVFGIPSVYLNVRRAWRANRAGIFRKPAVSQQKLEG